MMERRRILIGGYAAVGVIGRGVTGVLGGRDEKKRKFEELKRIMNSVLIPGHQPEMPNNVKLLL